MTNFIRNKYKTSYKVNKYTKNNSQYRNRNPYRIPRKMKICYRYYFLRALKFKMPMLIAQSITTIQIVQFVINCAIVIDVIAIKLVMFLVANLAERTASGKTAEVEKW